MLPGTISPPVCSLLYELIVVAKADELAGRNATGVGGCIEKVRASVRVTRMCVTKSVFL